MGAISNRPYRADAGAVSAVEGSATSAPRWPTLSSQPAQGRPPAAPGRCCPPFVIVGAADGANPLRRYSRTAWAADWDRCGWTNPVKLDVKRSTPRSSSEGLPV